VPLHPTKKVQRKKKKSRRKVSYLACLATLNCKTDDATKLAPPPPIIAAICSVFT
jgi:hypothetical protein